MRRRPEWLSAPIVMVLLPLALPASTEAIERYTLRTQKPFAEVLEDLEFAIGEENFRLTGRAQIGAAIAERHGNDFPEAIVVHFCNLEYARALLQADANNLLYMPCRVSLRQQEAQVIVDAWLLPEDTGDALALRREVNEVLRRIVRFAAR